MIKDLTEKQYELKLQELIQRMKIKSFVFRDDTSEKQRIRKDKALDDFMYFKETYFLHYATKPSGKFHQDMHMYSELTDCIVAIAGPREHGKTVDLGVIKPIWKALKEQIHFPVFIGGNNDLAARRTKQIKAEYLHNPRIIHDFGKLLNPFCADDEFITKDGVCYKSMGWREHFKGLLFGPHRPDYILIDDLEDSKTMNSKIADKMLHYIRGDVYGALSSTGGIVLWLGNNTNKESAFNYFKTAVEEDTSGNIIFKEYKAIKEDGTPLWPEGFTIKQLEHIRSVMGVIDFERHMQQNPVIKGDIFKEEWFKYWEKLPQSFDRVVTYCDPSLAANETSDYKAIITLGFAEDLYWVLDIWVRKATIDAMITKLYHLSQGIGLPPGIHTRLYMESNLWQKLLWKFIPKIGKKFGYLLAITGVENKLKKTVRIEGIEPYFEWGWIIFPSQKSKDLKNLKDQLLLFPKHDHDDAPDALSGACEALTRSSLPITGRIGDTLQSTDFRRMP